MSIFAHIVVCLLIGAEPFSESVPRSVASEVPSIKSFATASLATARGTDSSAPVDIFSQQEGQTGLPKETQAMLDKLRQKVEREAEMTELLSHAQSLFQEGDALGKKG